MLATSSLLIQNYSKYLFSSKIKVSSSGYDEWLIQNEGPWCHETSLSVLSSHTMVTSETVTVAEHRRAADVGWTGESIPVPPPPGPPPPPHHTTAPALPTVEFCFLVWFCCFLSRVYTFVFPFFIHFGFIVYLNERWELLLSHSFQLPVLRTAIQSMSLRAKTGSKPWKVLVDLLYIYIKQTFIFYRAWNSWAVQSVSSDRRRSI